MSSRPLQAVLMPPGAPAGPLLDALAAALDGTGPAILPLDAGLPRSRLDALLEAFAPAAIQTAHDRQQDPHGGPGGLAGRRPREPGVAEDVAVVLATSGSTGRPKGAELTAAALLAAGRASLARLGARPGERWLCCLPTHHISGLGVLVRSLLAGVTPRVAGRLDAGALAQAVADGCRYASLVPTQLARLLGDGDGDGDGGHGGGGRERGAALAQLRAILLGGAAVPGGLAERAAAAGVRVVATYGMTETCGGCVYDGEPLGGVAVDCGADGRISIGGPVLFSRYRLAPDLTDAALHDGWFRTCDLGQTGPDGRLVVRGRADDVINSGGEKVVAAEVEDALRRCPGVKDAAVVAVADPEWGERVTAVVVPADPAARPSLELLRAQVRDRLPRHAAPRAVMHLAEIPLLASGKPDRELLRALATRSGREADG